MNFTYENQGTSTFLVYTLDANEAVDSMSLGMITNNRIPGIANTVFMQLDSNKYIKYNVSSKIPVSQFFGGAVNRARLIGVFSGIIDAMLSAEEYMIDPNTILLDKDYIFADVSSCETVMVCIPIVGKIQRNEEVGTFFKNIMFSTQFDQTENCDYVGKIINYLNSTPIFSLLDFKKVLDDIKGTNIKQTNVQPSVQTQAAEPVRETVTPVQQPVVPKPSQPITAQPTVPVKTQTSAPAGMEIPGKPSTPAPETKGTTEDTKKISMFYLLQHYNKENAEAYKAQKAEKKEKSKEEKGKHDKKDKNEKKVAASVNPGFAIPGAPNEPIQQDASATVVLPQQPSAVYEPVPQTSQPVAQQSVPVQAIQSAQTGQPMNFGETTVLNAARAGETTVLSSSSLNMPVYPYLIRMKNNERIDINKPVFRIGKEKSYVDYFISDNSAISRSHANIISRDGEYFIVDTNSTNHTYINGALIQSNVEVKLVNGTKVRLANEEFEFKL